MNVHNLEYDTGTGASTTGPMTACRTNIDAGR